MNIYERIREENEARDRRRLEDAPPDVKILIEQSLAYRKGTSQLASMKVSHREHVKHLEEAWDQEIEPERKQRLAVLVAVARASLDEVELIASIHLTEWTQLEDSIRARLMEVEAEKYPEGVRAAVIELLAARDDAIRGSSFRIPTGGDEFGELAREKIRIQHQLKQANEAEDETKGQQLSRQLEEVEDQLIELWEERNRRLKEAEESAARPFDLQLHALKEH